MADQSSSADWLFYDGACGLCHGAVKFVIARDRDGSRFRFAPLYGDAFREHFPNIESLPDSIVVLTSSGSTLVRSDAVSYILRRLGGAWSLAGSLLAFLPRLLRDSGYDAIAKVRLRLFRRPEASCPVLPAHLAARFRL
jgi:predicted DCC family thiol-disulfide oxidoreductase YuxK